MGSPHLDTCRVSLRSMEVPRLDRANTVVCSQAGTAASEKASLGTAGLVKVAAVTV
jgi:hypothetical protein